ncbi:hypothetical protein TCAL_15058 [Tigriopus californicus]|uniref:Endonuclease/exonuclease/phosphatase domain-containing protein n=1 Tax=Tigriopus californicus TaxID=6832 RepID=A0A553P0I7_TIGCA|nr:uncharacterized protein LOC131887210 [Tigriopus californicus]XP_059091745.1 uncharacterized protein LOC131887210 [Tigriopus californicus]TRY71198.1 hypothetical protein TCAL_15058 [Tigriopus californicus]
MARKLQAIGGNYGQAHHDSKQANRKRDKSRSRFEKPTSRSTKTKTDSVAGAPRLANRQDPNTRYYEKSVNKYEKSGKTRLAAAQESEPNVNSDLATIGIVPSRKEVSLVTMNTSGKSVMGFTPKYKLKMMEEFLHTFPDAIFFQDAIELSDLNVILESVSEGKYEFYFQDMDFDKDEKTRKETESGIATRSLTGIAWNREKYFGTPLQLDDERLQEYRGWLKRHDLTIVKLDSREQIGHEDVYPSFISISWHGTDYEVALRQRIKECEEFFAFLSVLRENNGQMPILIGGDFNMDMKSFDNRLYPDFVLVPYRPVSGVLARDLRHTFVFTVDTLQATETGFKQHHPEIFPSPFVTARLRGRTKIRMWAIIRIQRAFRRMKKKMQARAVTRKQFEENKRRWKKKINGDDYESEPEEIPVTHNPQKAGKSEKPKAASNAPRDRRYALYWDERDDPRYQPEEDTRPLAERRRKDFTENPSNGMNVTSEKRDHIMGFRRQRFSDLKSVQDRKLEDEGNQYLTRKPMAFTL